MFVFFHSLDVDQSLLYSSIKNMQLIVEEFTRTVRHEVSDIGERAESVRREVAEIARQELAGSVRQISESLRREIPEIVRQAIVQEVIGCVRREVFDIKYDITEIARQQIHMQQKQDQLVSKQDLLQTSIVGDHLPPFLPSNVITSPRPQPSILSPSPSCISGTHPRLATGQALLQSPSDPQTLNNLEGVGQGNVAAESPMDTDLEDIISFLTDSQLPQQPLDQSNVIPSDQQIPVGGHGLAAAQQDDTHSMAQPEELVLRSPEEVLQSNKDLWNERGVGKLANKLARLAYFGDSVLAQSTRTGKERKALEEAKMASLLTDIHKAVFKSKSAKEFEDTIVPKVNASISALCKRLRNRK